MWIGTRLTWLQMSGLVVGMAGVLVLSAERLNFGGGGSGWSVVAALAATICYGTAVHYNRARLEGVATSVVACGTMWAAALCLAPGAWATWPEVGPSMAGCTLGLGLLCTALPFVIFYEVLGRIGGTAASTVTYMVPAFGVTWGGLFLGEQVTWQMMGGMAVTLAGTMLTTGLVDRGILRWAWQRFRRRLGWSGEGLERISEQ